MDHNYIQVPSYPVNAEQCPVRTLHDLLALVLATAPMDRVTFKQEDQTSPMTIAESGEVKPRLVVSIDCWDPKQAALHLEALKAAGWGSHISAEQQYPSTVRVNIEWGW